MKGAKDPLRPRSLPTWWCLTLTISPCRKTRSALSNRLLTVVGGRVVYSAGPFVGESSNKLRCDRRSNGGHYAISRHRFIAHRDWLSLFITANRIYAASDRFFISIPGSDVELCAALLRPGKRISLLRKDLISRFSWCAVSSA